MKLELKPRLKLLEGNQSSISIGRSCIKEYPYKSLSSNYIKYDVGLLAQNGFKDLLLASA